MVTHAELSQFRHSELSVYTQDQLNRLTAEELILIAEAKLELLSKKDSAISDYLRDTLRAVVANYAGEAVCKAVSHLIMFIQEMVSL